MGKLVLLPYFVTGTAVRLFSVILYFTPTLGLFDTLHHLNQGGNSKAPLNVAFPGSCEPNFSQNI